MPTQRTLPNPVRPEEMRVAHRLEGHLATIDTLRDGTLRVPPQGERGDDAVVTLSDVDE